MYAGAEWIKSACKAELSPLGVAAADLLGDVFLGIYHLPKSRLFKTDWSDPHYITITLPGELATYDSDELTRLVVLAHDRMLRVSIQGVGPGNTRLGISMRTTRDGSIYERMPTLEGHVQALRAHYSAPEAQ